MAPAPRLDLEHFRLRVLQDALTEATSAYWEHRADTFAAVGTETCDAIGAACRHHAWLLRREGLPEHTLQELVALLEEPEEVR